MVQIAKSYPVFEDNQVLTSGQLNELVTYLDEQTRLSRVMLTGMGVFCGMNLSWEANALVISAGAGITSEGYLIHQCECALTQYLDYELPESVLYEPFTMTKEAITFYELFPSDTKFRETDSPMPLTKALLQGKVVLLFLECFDEDLESCLGKSCDELGIKRNFNLRKLLVSVADAERILAKANCEDNSWNHRALLPISLARPLFMADGAESKDYNQLSSVYRPAIIKALNTIQKELQKSYEIYQQVLSPIYKGINPFHKAENRLYNEILNSWHRYLHGFDFRQLRYFRIQYFYDFLRDLISAYDEFRKGALVLEPISTCCPDQECFPKHLMLGQAIAEDANSCQPDPYRHKFEPAAYSDQQKKQIEQVQLLHARLWLMVEKFDLDTIKNTTLNKEIKITPSCEKKAPLAEHCIPFYYHSKEISTAYPALGTLEQVWIIDSYRKCLSSEEKALVSYENHDITQSRLNPIKTPLDFTLDPYNFFRIEGHQGRPIGEVLDQLKQFRKAKNLAFDIRTAWIGHDGLIKLEPGDCVLEDLQPQYDIWRNRLSYWLKNSMVWLDQVQKTVVADRSVSELLPRDQTISQSFYLDRYQQVLRSLQQLETNGSDDRISTIERREKNRLNFLLKQTLDTLSELLLLLTCELKGFSMPKWLDVFRTGFAAYQDFMKYLADSAKTPDQIEQITKHLQILAGQHYLLASYIHYPVNALQIIVDTLFQRTVHLSKDISLSQLINKHPGLDHQAGVPLGGTFILVYQGDIPVRMVAAPVSSSAAISTSLPNRNVLAASGLEKSSLVEKMEFAPDFYLPYETGPVKPTPNFPRIFLPAPVPNELTVCADFSLPYICCDENCDLPQICITPKPIVLPVVGIVHCHLVDDPSNSDVKVRRFDPLKLQMVDNLYDPKDFTLQITKDPNLGMLSLKTEAYVPSPKHSKTYIEYRYNPETSDARKLFGILTDHFDFRVIDKKTGSVIGTATATIFIPLCEEVEDEVLPRTKVVVKLVHKGTDKPFTQVATIELSGPENWTKSGTSSWFNFENILEADYTVTLESADYWAKPSYLELSKADTSRVFIIEVCPKRVQLHGQIVDKETGQPITKAKVYLISKQVFDPRAQSTLNQLELATAIPIERIKNLMTESEKDGSYQLQDIPMENRLFENAVVSVAHPDYEAFQQEIVFSCIDINNQTFALTPIKRAVKGEVLFQDAKGVKHPLPGIPLKVEEEGRGQSTPIPPSSATTLSRAIAPNHYFEYTNLRPTVYKISADGGARFTSTAVLVNLTQNSVEGVQIVLESKEIEALIGQVLMANSNTPIEGAKVWIDGLEERFSTTSESDKGLFQFSAIPLSLQPKEGFVFKASYRFTGHDNVGETVALLPKPGPVIIRIKSEARDGLPAFITGGVEVHMPGRKPSPVGGISIILEGLDQQFETVSNPKNGAFKFENLPLGRKITLISPATKFYEKVEKEVGVLVDGGKYNVVLVLVPRGGTMPSEEAAKLPTEDFPSPIFDSSLKGKVVDPTLPTDLQEKDLPVDIKIDKEDVSSKASELETSPNTGIVEKTEEESATKVQPSKSETALPDKTPVSELPDTNKSSETIENKHIEEAIPTEPVSDLGNRKTILESPIPKEPALALPKEDDEVDVTIPGSPEEVLPIKDSNLAPPEEKNVLEKTEGSSSSKASPIKAETALQPIDPLETPGVEAPKIVDEEKKSTDTEAPTDSEKDTRQTPELRKEPPSPEKVADLKASDPVVAPSLPEVPPIEKLRKEALIVPENTEPTRAETPVEPAKTDPVAEQPTPPEKTASLPENNVDILPLRVAPYSKDEIRVGIRQRMELYVAQIWKYALSSGTAVDSSIKDTTEALRYFSQITEAHFVRLNYRFGISRDALIKVIQQENTEKKGLYIYALANLTKGYLDKLATANTRIGSGMSAFTLRETAQLYNETDGIELQEIILKWMEGVEHWANKEFLHSLAQHFKLQ